MLHFDDIKASVFKLLRDAMWDYVTLSKSAVIRLLLRGSWVRVPPRSPMKSNSYATLQ